MYVPFPSAMLSGINVEAMMKPDGNIVITIKKFAVICQPAPAEVTYPNGYISAQLYIHKQRELL